MGTEMSSEEAGRTLELNGVEVGVVRDAVKAIQDNPEVAKFKFHVHDKWVSGGHNRAETCEFYGALQKQRHKQCFEWHSDEPAALAGSDMAPNPVEHLLNALAGCLTSTIVYHAALQGIKIEAMESELEGDLDLRGLLGLSNEVRRGYENIKVRFRVKTDARNLDRLKAFSKLSPVYDVTSNGTNVDVQIDRLP